MCRQKILENSGNNRKNMESEKNIHDETFLRAEKVMYYNDLLIKQCDSWLSAEEGNKNLMKQIFERRKAVKKRKKSRIINLINNFLTFVL